MQILYSYITLSSNSLLRATSHSTIFDIPMHQVREEPRVKNKDTDDVLPTKEGLQPRDGNYSNGLCLLHAPHARKSSSEKQL